MRASIHFSSYLAQVFLECFRHKFKENQNTYFIFNFFFENRDVYEIMSRNMVEKDRSLMSI